MEKSSFFFVKIKRIFGALRPVARPDRPASRYCHRVKLKRSGAPVRSGVERNQDAAAAASYRRANALPLIRAMNGSAIS